MSGRESRRQNSGGRRVQTFGLEKLPPHSIEAEQGVLGCMLMSPKDCVAEAATRIRTPMAFYDLRHQTLFSHLVDMWQHNRPIDLLTLAARFHTANMMEMVGGLGYVSSLTDAIPGAANLTYYTDIVREKYLLRKFMQTFQEGIGRIHDFEGEPAELMDLFEKSILDISRERTVAQDTDWRATVEKAVDAFEDYQRGGAQLLGLPTGFDYLDKMLCGLKPGEVILIAGRPGTGKTSLAFNIVEHVAVVNKVPVGVFSLEMSGRQLASRSIFQHARADYQRFRTGYMKNQDFAQVLQTVPDVARAPIKLDESSSATILDIRAKARRWVAEDGIKLLVVDYVGLVRGTRNFRDRKDEVGEVSRGIMGLAKELQIPVVLLSQLNRELEKDRNRVPQLSDLRDSGDLEQDAHVVGILYNPKLTKEEQAAFDEGCDWAKHSKRVNLQICKQREGPTGKVELLFEKSCMRFSSYKRAKQQESQEEL